MQARHAKLDIWYIEEAFAEFTKKCKGADVRRSKLFLDLIKMYDQTVGYLIDEEAAEKARNNAKIGSLYDDYDEPEEREYTKIFEEYFPYYLNIGMSAEEYWDSDPKLTKYFREADERKREREKKQLDFRAWLYGRYIAEAVAAVFSENAKYPTAPHLYDPDEGLSEEERKERQIERELAFHRALMNKYKR